MDTQLYLEYYGKRDSTTSFMRSLRELPQAEKIFTEDPLEKKDELFEIAIVGCSYGMEVYSYAMVCETNGFTNFRVDGFDAHSDRLVEGRKGRYDLWWATEIALTDQG
jgi:chemotaxis methyl-accepting protein methylase